MSASGKLLAAAAALIALVNALVLVGVVWNRGGEPESRVVLSQRELGEPWGGLSREENSGLALRIEWRLLPAPEDSDAEPLAFGAGGIPAWIDAARLAEFGIEVGDLTDPIARRRFEGQGEREVLVVLELAGPAWREALARARGKAESEAALRAANPDKKEFVEREKRAREQREREETDASRLFAIDIGRDAAALRARHPDRAKTMILRARLLPRVMTRGNKPIAAGYLTGLQTAEVNVPHALRPRYRAAENAARGKPARASHGKAIRFTATVAVGRRLEPWIEDLLP